MEKPLKILGVIPARFASSRFPGKPLVDINGKSMIQRVYEQVKQCKLLDGLLVATDDERISDHVVGFGGNVLLTSALHQSGTDRCAEVAKKLPLYDVIINIQGDEPFISEQQIARIIACFNTSETLIATLIKEIKTVEELENPNTPKVVINLRSEAIYFSRTPIPYMRGKAMNQWLDHTPYFKHIGIYGYRSHILQAIAQLQPSTLEKSEALEQLRWIENGYKVKVAITDVESIAIDTPEDLDKILNRDINT